MSGGAAYADGGALRPGQRVGEWKIVGRLGEGGFGAVYEAVHAEIGKRVAVKVLDAAHARQPHLSARFVREARAVARIGHPNIADVFAFGSLDDGRPYFVMELVPGCSLQARLRSGALPIAQAREAALDVALALDAAHRAGVVHRDLKPANVMLLPAGPPQRAKLLDFGIAKLADGEGADALRTGTGVLLGTPAYMSPEQCEGPDVGPASDVYSLGVLLFEMLTGQRPFTDTIPAQLLVAHLHKTPPRPSSLQPGLQNDDDWIVLHMLAKDPARRPRLEAVIRWARGERVAPVVPEPSGRREGHRPEPMGRRGSRRGPVFALVLAGLLGLGVWVAARGWTPTPAPVVEIAGPDARGAEGRVAPSAADEAPARAERGVERSDAGISTARSRGAALEPAPERGVGAEAPERIDAVADRPAGRASVSGAREASRGSSRAVDPKAEPAREGRPARSRRAPERRAARGPGFLTLTTTPWTQVRIDGRPVGTTPLYKIPLEPGRHALRLVNPGEGVEATKEVVIEAGEVTKVRHDLR